MNAFEPLIWSALLTLLGCALIVLEVFIPSGGILGFLAAAAVLSAIVLAFYHHGPVAGFAFVALGIVALPVALAVAFKYLPRTPMGRNFLLAAPTADEVLPTDDRHRSLKQLVGKTGVVRSPMLPSGAIAIDGRTIDAVSQGMAIEAGTPIEVIEVKGNRVVVRPVEAGAAPTPRRQDDVLSQPLDTLGLGSLDEPLA
ncbi:MAG: hypothetical protein A2W31_06280 [Planctomycetes bacterium RBG_16_64_10]|nr:MAG: hypothetical protein A2W31_06280 [Planctomycetes bacterium RBG_16_64_10]